ncbi:hypothetical protein [Streptomyces prasinus]|uniref:hypothetical protein n=1 Tax=Streptomyces prasinus TaxID=67345 RepID=UPI0014703810
MRRVSTRRTLRTAPGSLSAAGRRVLAVVMPVVAVTPVVPVVSVVEVLMVGMPSGSFMP